MKSLINRPSMLLWAVACVSLAAIAAALVSQHVYDMQPCPWCVLQRVVFAAMALVAVLGLMGSALVGALQRGAAGSSRPRRLVHAAALLGVSLLAAAGMAAALWQHLVAKSSSSCNLTLADRIVSGLELDALAPEVFAPRASCAEAAVDLLGLPYELWSLALFALVGAATTWAVVRALKAAAASG